ncbi:ASN_HP2_G0014610.mRNA.1.CDS.1 [Saccharomyces cerevisiae]|nr:ASN_HP2_G0014610.mRNA.1.CDS.1 [Saccharomyces cerevisiae]CAI6548719.1 ASN_HP2_G0014610.mRNA.1.CDS.1 [Saccharomyces cerevisiae]
MLRRKVLNQLQTMKKMMTRYPMPPLPGFLIFVIVPIRRCLGSSSIWPKFRPKCFSYHIFNIMGLIFVAFFSVFGAELGLRQMILSRYLVSNVTARIFSLINVIACVGWCVLNISVSAQLLNMVNESSGHECPYLGSLFDYCWWYRACDFLVTVSFMHTKMVVGYPICCLLVTIAQLSRSGNLNGEWVGVHLLQVFFLLFICFGSAAGWAYAADYLFMPKTTSKYKIFLPRWWLVPLFFTRLLGAASAWLLLMSQPGRHIMTKMLWVVSYAYPGS